MRKPKHKHSDRDRIYTPHSVAIKLIDKIPYNLYENEQGQTWCDPCLGDGAFYKNFPYNPLAKNDWYEIDKGKDFLQCNKKYHWCVTNIPFSKPKEFIFKMAECSILGFGVLCLANSMTATRLKKLEIMGFFPDSITILYIKEWGFGYRTDFYVFTKRKKHFVKDENRIETIII